MPEIFYAAEADAVHVDLIHCRHPEPQLLFTSRQISDEARAMFQKVYDHYWQENHFVLEADPASFRHVSLSIPA